MITTQYLVLTNSSRKQDYFCAGWEQFKVVFNTAADGSQKTQSSMEHANIMHRLCDHLPASPQGLLTTTQSLTSVLPLLHKIQERKIKHCSIRGTSGKSSAWRTRNTRCNDFTRQLAVLLDHNLSLTSGRSQKHKRDR
jgi:hypothetical protein